MLVGDIDEPVVAAAARTPFESRRRVFVIEGAAHAERPGRQPPAEDARGAPAVRPPACCSAERPRGVLPTIASRCQLVRFDPLPSARIEERLTAAREGGAPSARAPKPGVTEGQAGQRGVEPQAEVETLAACARLALGDARLAGRLAGARAARCASARRRSWAARSRGETAERQWVAVAGSARRPRGRRSGEELAARVAEELELVPAKERKRHEREAAEAQRRAERRARTGALDLALRLAELWLRDVWCVAEGAGELVYAVDRRARARARRRGPLPGAAARGRGARAGHASAAAAQRLRGARAGGARLPAAGAARHGLSLRLQAATG